MSYSFLFILITLLQVVSLVAKRHKKTLEETHFSELILWRYFSFVPSFRKRSTRFSLQGLAQQMPALLLEKGYVRVFSCCWWILLAFGEVMSCNVGTTIVNHPPPYFFFFFFGGGGGGRFAIVNFRSQLSPQIKKTNQNHSTTIKRIKKKEKNQCEPKKLFIVVRIYTYL